jgi:N-6 DNA Methylase
MPGGVLQRSNIHLATCAPGEVTRTLAVLKGSLATQNPRNKIKFILATDGETVEAEDLSSAEGGTLACSYPELPNHFGFFLALAGITTVAQIRDNAFDIRATSRLNRLYIELLKDNPEWDKEERRHDLNQFMARLIFCFFAENTGIFHGEHLFTRCIEQMTEPKPASKFGNTHEVIQEIFRAMDTKVADRGAAGIRPYADGFDYVNGGLFSGNKEVPKFSRIARSYLLHAGALPWQQINPDIFGSMIQAVADDEERGNLGLHYTSVPNILKVLNPLFLDSLREQLEQAGANPRKLLNLRKRIANVRVFDPACGSGNFLVISFKEMRKIEAEIIRRRNDEKKSWIKLSNFHGIEIKDFAAEIAKLALLIAEFQCDVEYIGQREALLGVLPLKETGQIHAGNALRMDWLKICPPVARKMVEEHDLAAPTGRLLLEGSAEDGEIEPETY